MNDAVKKRAAVCDAWDAYRKQPALLGEIERLDRANKLLANRFNQAIAQRDTAISILDGYRKKMIKFENRRWWQRLFS